ncbi:hypothetical protein M3Y94_00289900 [Aphelenchoides besseyi]|nr:hypothetical protein M3Y94_00289900 [Aphelenchoides besseyi]KAI6235913.1 hypothetical protein M3Y95_00101800 [Aphelenchoides besseyi]
MVDEVEWFQSNQWLPTPDYLHSLWEGATHLFYYTSRGLHQTLTDPANFFPLLCCALLGIIVPVTLLIMWRLFQWKQNKTKEIVEDKTGKFNEKLLSTLKIKSKGKKPKKVEESEFAISRKTPPSTAASPTPLLTSESRSSSVDTIEPKSTEIEPALEFNSTGESVNSTRMSSDFELDDEAMKKLCEMEFHGKLKTATLRARAEKLQEGMSKEEREKENMLKMKQMEEIFRMMQSQSEKFGIEDKSELYDQLKLYTT